MRSRRRLAAMAAIVVLAVAGVGCGGDDDGDSSEAEAPSGPLTLEQIEQNLEDADGSYYSSPQDDEVRLEELGAIAGLEAGSEDDSDGNYFGASVWVFPEPVDEAAVTQAFGDDTVVEFGEDDAFVFTAAGPHPEENAETMREIAEGG